MDTSESMEKVFSALSRGMHDEELMLSVLQSMIAAEIIGQRIKKKMTQKELSSLLGVSQSTLSKWESGETNFTLSTLVSIASKLEIDMQPPFVPTPPRTYQSKFSNIIVFTPPGWSSPSTFFSSHGDEIETKSYLEEM